MPDVPVCAACGVDARVQWRRRADSDPASTVPVYACGGHAIGLDLAAHVHAPTCTAPDAAHLPDCGCTPEPMPAQDAPSSLTTVTLSTGWVVTTPQQ